jgi:hypothetical protein
VRAMFSGLSQIAGQETGEGASEGFGARLNALKMGVFEVRRIL